MTEGSEKERTTVKRNTDKKINNIIEEERKKNCLIHYYSFLYVLVAESCEELKERGLVDSVPAEITGKMNIVVWVHCNMTALDGIGVTEIGQCYCWDHLQIYICRYQYFRRLWTRIISL